MKSTWSLGFAAILLASCGMLPASTVEQPTTIPTFTPASPASPPSEQVPPLGGKQSGDLSVWIYGDPNPPERGDNTLEVFVADADGKPVSDAAVNFDIDMTNMSHGSNLTVASALGEGRYSGTVFFLMPGPWRVIVGVERAGRTESVRFDFMVEW